MAVKKLKKAGPKKRAAVKRVRPTYALPTERKEPDLDISHYMLLVYGREKIGKTTLFASFPDAIFFPTEPGTKGLRIYEFNAPRGIDSWETFLAGVSLLEKNPDEFKTVIVDTADRAYDLCMAYVCKLSGVEHPHDANDYGKTWNKVKAEFLSVVDRILRTGRGVCFTSHAKEQEIESKSGAKYTRIFPTMSTQARAVIEALVDMFFYVEYMTDIKGRTRRVIITKGDETIWAGHREIGAPLPRFLPLKKRNGYEVLQKAFAGEDVGIPARELHVGRQTSKPGKGLLVKAKQKGGRDAKRILRK